MLRIIEKKILQSEVKVSSPEFLTILNIFQLLKYHTKAFMLILAQLLVQLTKYGHYI